MVEGTPDAISMELSGILVDLKGVVGQRKMQNLQVIRRKLLNEMSEGGDVAMDFESLLGFVSARTAFNALKVRG